MVVCLETDQRTWVGTLGGGGNKGRGLNRRGGMSGDRSGNMGRYMKRGEGGG